MLVSRALLAAAAAVAAGCATHTAPPAPEPAVAGRCAGEPGVCLLGVPAPLEEGGETIGWRCLGLNGGTDAACALPVPAPAPPAAAVDGAAAATEVAQAAGAVPRPRRAAQAAARQEPVAARAQAQIAALLAAKAQRTAAQRKMSSRLLDAQLVDAPRDAPGQPLADDAVRDEAGAQIVDERVLVDIQADVTPEVLARIPRLGGTVVNSVPRYRAIRAQLPPGAVELLAALDAVQTIRPADEAQTRGQTAALGPAFGTSASDAPPTRKANTSAGDVAHRADLARRTHGVDGGGIGIGVLSDGVRTLAQRQASGDLPARVTVLPGQAGTGDEGTAMLEIVHDLAPGAELYFATGWEGQAQFAANIEALCDAGADVIVDDVYYYHEAVLQDGLVAQGVNTAVADGCFYFSAAGNEGNLNDGTSTVWEGDYAAGSALVDDGDTLGVRHDFGGGVEENVWTVSGPSRAGVVLQWADPLGASANDYDLFVVDEDGNVTDSSTNTQDGTQDPIEYISFTALQAHDARLVVVKASGADRYLRLQPFQGRLAVTTAGNTFGHAAAENALSVGAVNVRTAGGEGGVFDGTESAETFSSDGPRRIFFQPDGTPITAGDFSATGGKALQKPDFVAANRVSTATPGFSTFAGTSAAAPHAAAIGALALEAAGGPANVTLAALRTALTGSALDIEATGVDRDSGAGIVMAPAAVDGVDVPVATRNRAPVAAGVLADRTLAPGGAPVTIDVASAFTDPDDDALTYALVSSNADRVAASLTGASLTLTPLVPGRVAVTVRATDPGGLRAERTILVTVEVGDRDYDLDDDGLIEVANLGRLDAMRYDRDGDGTVDDNLVAAWRTYYLAFPDGAWNMGCPDGCSGYELTEDLDFDTNGNGLADAGDAYWNNGAGWAPIGGGAGQFTAILEGNGHTLANLFIQRTSGRIWVGLIGLAHGAEIRNLRLVDVDVDVAVAGRAALQVGGLVGHSDDPGSITGCHVTGRVTVTASGAAASDRRRSYVFVGGLAGVNGGGIAASHAEVHVTATVSHRTVVVGGLVGRNNFYLGRITTSHASGRVTASGADTTVAGGLVGRNYLGSRIVNSYATGPVTASGVAGGLVGANPNAWTVASYATGPVTATGASGIAGGLVGRASSDRFFSPSRIVAVYATGRVTATGSSGVAGGLVGRAGDPGSASDARSSRIAAAYATGRVTATGASGIASGLVASHAGGVQIADSYWDTWTGGTSGGSGAGRTTQELQAPTGYSGPYAAWNVDLEVYGATDDAWRFGTGAQYPALAVDVDGDGQATWQEFGRQLRAGPTLTATASATATPGQAQVALNWTAVDAGHWDPAPGVSYTVTRADGPLVEILAENVAALQYTDPAARTGAEVTYQVAAVVDGGEPVRSAVVEVDTPGNSPPLPVGTLPDRWLHVGDAAAVEFAAAFGDPENDALTYEVSSSATDVATVSLSGTRVTITPVAEGTTTIAVTATDAGGSAASATQAFTVTVLPSTAVDYDTDDDGLIEITTLGQLDAVRHDLDGDGAPTAAGATAYAAAFSAAGERQACGGAGCAGYELLADLDFDTNGNGRADAGDTYWNAGAGWAPLGPQFSAIFEGNGHTLANLFINATSEDYVGLFLWTTASSVIRNVGVIDADVTGAGWNAGELEGTRNAGGLAGFNEGEIRASYVTGRVSGSRRAGGLVGFNAGAIAGSYAAARVSGVEDAGGLAGRNTGDVIASYATGRVSGAGDVGGLVGNDPGRDSVITASYATGYVSGTGGNVGGLVGSGGVAIHASYWDRTTSGRDTGIHGAGRSTAALQAPTGYSGIYSQWDVDFDGDGATDAPWDPWDFGTNAQYPVLQVDFDGDGQATWQEFGRQLRAGPTLTATGGPAQMALNWTAVDVSHWNPAPGVTYTLTRDDGATVETAAEEVGGLTFTDTGLVGETDYTYQVAAVVAGGEATRGAPVSATTSNPSSGPNQAPQAVGSLSALTLRIADGAATVDVSGAFQDPDNDVLTYGVVSSAPAVASVRMSGSVVTLTPLTAGVSTVTVTATDAAGSNTSATQQFVVTVANRSPEPVGTLSDRTLQIADGAVTVDVSGAFRDLDGDALTYGAVSSTPAVATVSVSSSTLTLTPLTAGVSTVTVTATDAAGSNTSATQQFVVTVANRPPEPVGTLSDRTLQIADGAVTVDVSGAFRDLDGDALTYGAVSSTPAVATVSVSSSTLTLTPLTAGVSTVTVTATDAAGSNTSATQPFVVTAANRPPEPVGTLSDRTLQIADGAVTVDVSGAFRDLDGDALTYGAVSSSPAVATVSISSSTVTLTPLTAGVSTVTVTATDVSGSNSSASQQFVVTVEAGGTVDYDADDDGLIEIAALAQLDAVRHDLDGDGAPTETGATAYGAAFPDPISGMGCPAAGCAGYELVADLDFDTDGSGSADAGDAYWNAGAGWAPLGSGGAAFATTFEGNGHTLAHLFINRGADAGLFGVSTSAIRHVGVVDAAVTGASRVGGLVGQNIGAIVGSYVTGSVSGGTSVGGLVGFNVFGGVYASYATAVVSGETSVGGLVGGNFGMVSASYATGGVTGSGQVGGLAGQHFGVVGASYATGRVSGDTAVSGLLGAAAGRVAASYWDQETSGWPGAGAGAGQSTSALQGPTGYADLYAGWDVDVDGDGAADAPWHFGTAGQYPALAVDFDGDGRATWQEFGRQLREGPAVKASSPASGTSVAVRWTAVDTSHWTPPPAVSYAVYRRAGDSEALVAAAVDGLSYTDSGAASGVEYRYQVAVELSGGEASRSGAVVPNRWPETVGGLSAATLRIADGAVTVDVSGAFRDADDDELTYGVVSSAPAVATVSMSSAVVTLTPLTAGVSTVTVTATDAAGSNTSATQQFVVTVANRSPEAVGTLSDRTLQIADGAVTVDVSGAFRDLDGDALTYGAVSATPAVATVSVSSSTLTLTPLTAGVSTVTVTATDAAGSNTSARQQFVVTVANRPPEPVGTLSDRTLQIADGEVTLDVSGAFRDLDGDALTYGAVSSSPAVATVSVSSSTLTLTPLTAGVSTVTVSATDAGGSNTSATQQFVVTVANRSPEAVGTLSARTLRISDGAVTVDVSGGFRDLDGDALTYGAASSSPAVATVSVSSSTLTLTPLSAGASTVTVTATDAGGSNTSARQQFVVTVAGGAAVDYDADDDGLIEIATLAQLDAVRHDLDGDGAPIDPGAAAYGAAYPDAVAGMGCPAAGCAGYELVADLDFDTDGSGSPDAGDAYWNAGAGWAPLGSGGAAFATTFEGNGHTLAHLFINRGADAGLFGVSTGAIRHVGVVDAAVTGASRVGGLVGQNIGAIVGSYVTGSVSGGTNVGGLVGFNLFGGVYASYATTVVSGATSVGGLVGGNFGIVTASYATGGVTGSGQVGGLAGQHVGVVAVSYATGRVSGDTAVSGLLGAAAGRVTASYWDQETSGWPGAGAGAGQSTSALQGPTGYADLYAGWNVDVDSDGAADAPWHFGTAGQYPALAVDFDGDGAATWQEFGRQLREGPAVKASSPASGTPVEVSWTAVDTSHWTPPPAVSYAVYRTASDSETLVAAAVEGLSHTDSGAAAGVEYRYQVAVELSGGEASRSGAVGPNRWPEAVGGLSAVTLRIAAGAVAVDVSGAFRDLDGDALTYGVVSSAPAVATVSMSSSVVTLTPLSAGVSTVTVTATDAGGSNTSATQQFVVTVANRPPEKVGTLTDLTLQIADGAVTVDVSGAFRDLDGDALTYGAVSSSPAVATVSVSNSTLTLTPLTAGVSTVTVTATDAAGSNTSASQQFEVTVELGGPFDYDTDDDGLIEIATLAQLDAVRHDLDGDGAPTETGATAYMAAFPDPISGMGCPATGCAGYELVADLDFDTDGSGSADAGDAYWNDGAGWVPLGSAAAAFATTFEGNGHTVAHLFVNRGADAGLFGVSTSAIRHVGVVDASVTGTSRVGGLVGQNVGAIRGSYATGSVSGGTRVGGLVGFNVFGGVYASYATAAVSGATSVGGLVGGNFGWVSASYATGGVTGSGKVGGLAGQHLGLVGASYATGRVSGDTEVGGLTGAGGGRVTASYWDQETSGWTGAGAGSGQSTSALQGPTGYAGLYAGWDVDVDGDGAADVPWDFGTSSEYPALAVDANGDGVSTWRELGQQGRAAASATSGVRRGAGVRSWGTSFSDDPLRSGVTPVRAVHLLELRARVDGLRRRAGLGAFGWTDATITPGVTPARAVHVTELRKALSAAYAAAGRPAPGYTDPVVTAGATPLRALHLQELRAAVVALEAAAARRTGVPSGGAVRDAGLR